MVELRDLRPGRRLIGSQADDCGGARGRAPRLPRMTVVGLSLLVALVGCRANKPSIITARTAFSAGDFSTAKTVLEELAAGPKQTRQVSELDLALVELAQGNGSEAEARLRKLRDFFDQQPTHPLTNDVVSLAADDTLRRFEISGR